MWMHVQVRHLRVMPVAQEQRNEVDERTGWVLLDGRCLSPPLQQKFLSRSLALHELMK